MDTITAISNSKIRHIRRLARERDYRYEHGEYLVEGINIVNDMPKSLIKALYVSADNYDRYSTFCADCAVVDDKVMAAISDTKSQQGVIAVAAMPKPASQTDGGACVVADNIADPGNLGTIIRTAAACGVGNIVLYGNVCDPYSPRAVRASMGGIFHVKFTTQIPNNLYLLDMGGTNIYDSSLSLPHDFALAVGSEAHGISKELYEHAQGVLSLPMCDHIESLNAAISLSVALYHAVNVLVNNNSG